MVEVELTGILSCAKILDQGTRDKHHEDLKRERYNSDYKDPALAMISFGKPVATSAA